jgi:hypothetical protein
VLQLNIYFDIMCCIFHTNEDYAVLESRMREREKERERERERERESKRYRMKVCERAIVRDIETEGEIQRENV